MTELILASTSPARRALLSSLGLPFSVEAPGVDETVLPGTAVTEAVVELARRKAAAVFARHPNALIIGSDQLVALDGVALGKPENAEAALDQLRRLSGRAHDIHTGVALLGPQVDEVVLDSCRLIMAPLDDQSLQAYVATGEWQGCAGGYRIEGRGQLLFERFSGDRASIQGLPMQRVVQLLRAAKVPVWSAAP